ncbi:DUF7344 domain-containing protein [Natronosalvus caseinilyticus]|uniref:DUF7344 domain-containing protein n=1 Tax=Natronosalvus caseinilyticus TaxID=2953747 RepID=UPI003CCDB166
MPPATNDDESASLQADIAVGDVCSVLANEWCRSVLYYFQESTPTVASYEALITHRCKHDDTIDTREQAAIALQHVTLPKLEEAGIIEYDGRSSSVRYRGFPQLETMVRLVAEMEDEL